MTKPKKLTDEVAAEFIKQAKEMHESEGELEIDEVQDGDALKAVSVAAENIDELNEAGGMYVRAWVWVRNEELSPAVRKKFGIKD